MPHQGHPGHLFCPQHVVFSIGRVLDLLAHDIPGSVEIKVKREYCLAKQALAEDEVSAPAPGALPLSCSPFSALS